VGGECAVKQKHKIDIVDGKCHTRIYLAIYEGMTFWPADDEAGTPARLEISGSCDIEFEGEVSVRPE